jgi:hypothetical protein
MFLCPCARLARAARKGNPKSDTSVSVKPLVASGDLNRTTLHATEDSVSTRHEVYAAIADHDFRIDCTLLEKPKALPRIRPDEPTFYKYAWFYHFRHVGPRVCPQQKKTLITAAALGDKKKRAAFKESLNNVVQQIVPREQWEVSFIDSSQDPCLWLADYCAWAIQRRWERDDPEYYRLIEDKIVSQFDLFRTGTTLHY